MNFQDVIITPIYLALFYSLGLIYAYARVQRSLRKYFFLGLSLKFFGAIVLGLIYQFYYGGGDTFNYWQHGSRWIWEAFLNSPMNGLEMIFGDASAEEHMYYFQRIMLKRSSDTLFVVKVAAFFDLFTFHTYSATALWFAMISFVASWKFFTLFSELFPELTRGLFLSIFAIPSVVIWGSGIMKDSLTLAALLMAFSIVIEWVILKRKSLGRLVIFLICFWILYIVKLYILVCFVPSIFLLIYFEKIKKVRSTATKIVVAPLLGVFILVSSYFITDLVSASNKRYAFESIPEWTMITAYDLGYLTGKDAGSSYSLGELDGSWGTMLSKMLPAINVTLFRPYPWEVSNVLMLISSMESTIMFLIFLFLIFFRKRNIKLFLKNPVIIMILIFSIVFAFAVGISTYNFGTLSRYKIPVLPMFAFFLVFWGQILRTRKYAKAGS